MDTEDDPQSSPHDPTRRAFLGVAALVTGLGIEETALVAETKREHPALQKCSLTINNVRHDLDIESRVTLLDLFREHLHLNGTKKGCDHGQCGACTVIADGERILSCLSLAVAFQGAQITTVEGLAQGDQLHPIQAAFLEYDGFQCGFCTPGQLCSAVAMLSEVQRGLPSAVTADVSQTGPVTLTDPEIRERMAGNLCRCGAYPNIVAAIRAVGQRSGS